MARFLDAYVALLRQEMMADLSAAAGLPPVLPVLVYTGDRRWHPPSMRRLTAPAPAGLQRLQPELQMLPLDATKLSAEDGEVSPMAALLRLQRCRRLDELPTLTAPLFDALRREDRKALAERLADAVMRMLVARFGGDETGAEHKEELRRALRHMEEPKMLAETATRWRQEALDEGMRLGVSEGISHQRALLRRLAARRFGIATGDALAALLANEEDVERLAKVGDLVLDCATADNLLRRGRSLLNGGS